MSAGVNKEQTESYVDNTVITPYMKAKCGPPINHIYLL